MKNRVRSADGISAKQTEYELIVDNTQIYYTIAKTLKGGL